MLRIREENNTTKTGLVNRGLQKLFDELFTNAGDYSQTNAKIHVTFDAETGRFRIENPEGIRVHLMEDGVTWSVEAGSTFCSQLLECSIACARPHTRRTCCSGTRLTTR